MESTESEGEYKATAKRILDEGQRGQGLLQLVESMGSDLTDESLETRTKAVRTLSSVVAALPCDFLNKDEIESLVGFFMARFLDHHSLIPFVLTGLKALSMQKELSSADALLIADGLVNNHHFQVQTLRQAERMAVFVTLTNLFAFFDMASLAGDPPPTAQSVTPNQLLFGFIQSIDGEKDPRNLLLVFDLATTMACTFSLAQLGDDLFDVISCYFPIDFSPPSSKNPLEQPVTADELRAKLRRFLAANPGAFHAQCLPLVVEKLTSSLPSARKEACDALTECAATYPPKCFEPHLLMLWDSLQSELFNPLVPSGSKMNSFADCLSAVVANICKDDAIYRRFCQVATTQLNRFVSEKNLRFVKQSAMCIAAVLEGLKKAPAKAVPLACNYLAQFVELFMAPAGENDVFSNVRQRRLTLAQSIYSILHVDVESASLDAKLADDLVSALLSCASSCVLSEPGSSITTVEETASCALRSIGSMAKWNLKEPLLRRTADKVIELALQPATSAESFGECVKCCHCLLQVGTGCDGLIDRVLSVITEQQSKTQLFDVAIAICCADQTGSALEVFLNQCVEWNQDGAEKLVETSFGALLVIIRHRGKQAASDALCEKVIKPRLLERRLASENFRQLAAVLVDWRYLLSLFEQNRQLAACDVVNVLSLCPRDKDDNLTATSEWDGRLCLEIAESVLTEMSQLGQDPSLDFCFNLSAFMVKFLPDAALAKIADETVGSSPTSKCLVIVSHALVVAKSPDWPRLIDKLVAIMSNGPGDQATEVAVLFGQMFTLDGDSADPTVSHPRLMFKVRVSALRRQALISRMATPLADNVRSGCHIVACLTTLTDLSKLLPGNDANAKSLLEPVLPCVVGQLEQFPTDRLSQVLALLGDHLGAILATEPQREAMHLLETLLKCIFSALTYDVEDVENQENELPRRRSRADLQTRAAAVNLLVHLAAHITEHPLLLGPLEKRILKALRPCVDDHKRLVRSAAANAINKWACS